MTNEDFKMKFKKWLNHKLILSQKSQWYRQKRLQDAVQHVNNIFGTFLLYPSNYNVFQLAMQVRKHEDLLMVLLPIPNNPTYESAFNTLAELLMHAEELVKQQIAK